MTMQKVEAPRETKHFKVSVIVPVYNVEKYLEKCLDSLVKQTLDEIEIIVVNDGSTDHSQGIIERFAQLYPEKVFGYVKTNGGLGDARNFGIDHAHGDYIGFVDSDDWVDGKMFQLMYDMAVEEHKDVVMCDLITINDGWAQGHVTKGFQLCEDIEARYITMYEYILNSLSPSFAWNKIYKRELFRIKRFPEIWYEDMGCSPVLLSYCNAIGYLPIALYYYRQRATSITANSHDHRNRDVIKAWEICLTEGNQYYAEAMEAAVYKSIVTFLSFRPIEAEYYLEFAQNNKHRFMKNTVIRNWIRDGVQEDLFKKKLIPKKIHYFWFGGNPKSELIQRCIESWKRNAPDFEIIEWNETNCDMHVNSYVEEAVAAKKWAFVADYFRLEKVAEHGGIYFDTDVELMQNPSILRLNSAFFAFETKSGVNASAFGAVPHHPVIDELWKSYRNDHLLNKDGALNTSNTIVVRVTKSLMKYGLNMNGQEQMLSNGVKIYPPNVLTLDMFDGKIIAQHHYDCSWWDVKVGVINYKNTVLRDFFEQSYWYQDENVVRERDYYKSECERLENTTCWKITKPIRILGDFIKRFGEKKGA